MKQPTEFFTRCRVIDRETGAELYRSETVPITGEIPRQLDPELARAKEKMKVHAGEAASEIYAQRPEAFGG